MTTILDRIITTKREEIAHRAATTPLEALRERAEHRTPARGFAAALQSAVAQGNSAIIAEIKKASPSRGVIRDDFDPPAIATTYAAHGATCLSVLTDEQYFQGHDTFLSAVRETVALPVLRKDFTIDEYQIYEAAALGADCVLLIVAALDIMRLTVLHQLAKGLGMDVLLEVHDPTELAAALSLAPDLVGINNRNLKTFDTSLNTTLSLLPDIPDGVLVVTESGISSRADVSLMRENGVHCFLVGEAFMRAPDPGAALAELIER